MDSEGLRKGKKKEAFLPLSSLFHTLLFLLRVGRCFAFCAFAVSALVPFIEEWGDVAFPILAPRTVMSVMPPAMSHTAEEEHLHCPEEQEEEQEREADRAEWIEEVRVTKTVHMRVAISVHHG